MKSGQRPKNSKRRSVASKVSYREESNSEGDSDGSEDEEFRATSEEDTEDEQDKPNKVKKQINPCITSEHHHSQQLTYRSCFSFIN